MSSGSLSHMTSAQSDVQIAMADHIDLEQLYQYLVSVLSPDDCTGLSDLDGLLTGIIIGPHLIIPSEWLPVIWGDNEQEFESTAHAETIIGLIMGRYNEIATGVMADPEKFEPIFWKQQTGEVIVMDWTAGFLDAVELRRASWEPLFGHRNAKLVIEPFLILGDDDEFDDERDPGGKWKEFYASRPDVIPNCVIGIYNFWKDHMRRGKPQPRRDRRPRH
jgi:uncharacterized protein